MLTVKCTAPDSVTIGQLTPFQGALKKRTDSQVKALAKSLVEDGLLMPFAIWQQSDVNYILDGHGRLAALQALVDVDPSIAEQEFPCITIQADSEEEARKSLLQITSTYGKVTKAGALEFCKTIPEYHAPAINAFVHPAKREHNKAEKPKAEARITLYVPVDREKELRDLLSKVDFIKVV